MTTYADPFADLAPDATDRPRAEARSAGVLGFWLFLLLTAVLFIRPAEVVQALEGQPIYLLVLVACLLATAPAFVTQFSPRRLAAQPAATGAVLFLVAVLMSHLQRGYVGGALEGLTDFGKTIVYFILLLAVVDTPERVGQFARSLGWLVFVVAALALAHYHQFISIEALDALKQGTGVADEYGQFGSFDRLQATGLFSDPNDFSLALCVALVIFVHRVLTAAGPAKLIALGAASVCAYAFVMTRSRGGFLAMLAAIFTYTVIRSGRRRAIVYVAVLLPAVVLAFAGRQTSIDLNDQNDTAHGRITLWRDGLQYFRQSPLFGIGHGEYAEEVGQVAHNSYVNCFVELGFFGGAAFVGMLYVCAVGLRRATADRDLLPLELDRLLPCVGATLAAYCVGMCSLSRQYALPTYAVIGLAAAFCGVAARYEPDVLPRLSWRLVARISATAAVVFLSFYVFVRVMA